MEEYTVAQNDGKIPEPAIKPTANSKLQLIVLVVASILFGLAILSGIYSGFSLGRSKATLQNAAAINTALQYYKADQNVYPTADQFYTQRILVPFYLPALPVPADVNGSCGKFNNFYYSQSGPNKFVLEFCLTSGTNGLGSGLHAFTEKGLQ